MKQTVASAVLNKMAQSYEDQARGNHTAWILVGNYSAYGDYMDKAYTLRRAAAEPSIWVRREILRNAGIPA